MRAENKLEDLAPNHSQESLLHKFKRFLIRHIADSTAILMATTPIYIFVELVVLQVRPEVSLRARLVIIGLTYLGTGILVAKGRDLSKFFFGLSGLGVAERKILIHDLFYLVTFNAVFGPIVYTVSGATWDELIQATLFAMGLSFFTGPINGYFIDAMGQLTELRATDRLPTQIGEMHLNGKLTLLFVMLALWIMAFIAVYNQQIF